MTTLARTEPCGQCQCCQAGKRCAHVLLLGPKERAVLARLDALGFGKSEGTIQWSPIATSSRRTRSEPPEPTTSFVCESCEETFEVFTYIVNTLKARGLTPRRCERCRHAGPRRADLA